MPDLQNLLDQIDRLDQEATKGPWEYDGSTIDSKTTFDEVVTTEVNCSMYCYGGTGKGVQDDHDAEFIALARTALPQLAKAVRAVMEDCQSIENLIHKDHTYRTGYDYGMRSQARAVMEAITDALKGQDND